MPLLTVATYNIKCDYPGPGELGWRDRREAVCHSLKSLEADVVGLQEAMVHQLDDVAHALPEFEVFGVGRDDGGRGGEWVAVLVRRGRAQVLESNTVWISATPEVPGSLGPGARFPRTITWVSLTIQGSPLRVANTHLDHESPEARLLGAKMLGELGAEVILGDFNCEPDEPPCLHLTGLGYALAPVQPGAATFNDWDPFCTEGQRIDHVLGKGVKLGVASVVRTSVNGVLPSDHFPVVCPVSW